MTFPDGLAYLVFAAISLLTAALAVVLTARFAPIRAIAAGEGGEAPRPMIDVPHRYEFREGYLLSPVAPDDAFLPEATDRTGAFDALSDALADLHPDLPARMRALRKTGAAFVLSGQLGQDPLSVAGRQEEGRVILSIGPGKAGDGREAVDGATFSRLQKEADDLRSALDATAIPMWKQDEDGRIGWANAAYLAVADQALGGAGGDAGGGAGETPTLGWPLPQVFGDQIKPLPTPGTMRRCGLSAPEQGDIARWFEVSAQPQADGGAVCVARPIDRLVAAETSLRDFVQTLSKTFASLPTGLAVFDKRRELVMFNPSLVTQSTLGVDFLSGRPTLVEFLDHLRERRRMPEPRDYRGWRDEIARLEQGAAEGTYHELWSLPDGDSLRVTGRPHPDGAVAFLFEDISQEVTLTRQFRADLDIYRSVLEDDVAALAVFARDGQMILSNAAYAALWGDDPREAAVPPRLADATRHWQARCHPTGIWGEIRQFAAFQVERAPWVDVVTTDTEERLACRVSPLRGGATLVRFQSLESDLTDPLSWPAASLESIPVFQPAPRRAAGGMAEPGQAAFAPPRFTDEG